MADLDYVSIFPLNISGGSSSIAGLTSQGIKSSDFTAVANSIYEITASCKMTLPSSPSTNDKIYFYLSSTANFDITSTNKINGAVLPPDYIKRVSQTGLFIPLNYSGSTNGWVWDARDSSYFSQVYAGTGISLSFSSFFDTNGLFYYLGTNLNTETYSESNLLAKMTVNYAYQLYDGTPVTGGFFDRNTSTFKNIVGGNNSTEERANTLFDMKGTSKMILDSFSLIVSPNGSFQPFTLYGSNDNSTWDILYDQSNSITVFTNGAVNKRNMVSSSFNTTPYRYFRFNRAYSTSGVTCAELEFYGIYLP